MALGVRRGTPLTQNQVLMEEAKKALTEINHHRMEMSIWSDIRIGKVQEAYINGMLVQDIADALYISRQQVYRILRGKTA